MVWNPDLSIIVNSEKTGIKLTDGFADCTFTLRLKNFSKFITDFSVKGRMMFPEIVKQDLSTSPFLKTRYLDLDGLKLVLVPRMSFSSPFGIHLQSEIDVAVSVRSSMYAPIGGCRSPPPIT